ncbi:NADH-quinone oxidoreductase subunit NuoG [Shewanella sp. UCD-KL12]|uniref:NADH-quinone oxidoreductase subunit NuoG n=1 Tax=Shewanella sp. UCD-KL12 TaxID=1917163 RepID=UPI000970568B|nr:NADH-quinone oxidoreductase subunit NuoG [Shewanella sp. UCD-KL12]
MTHKAHEPQGVTITIDNKNYQVPKAGNLLQACLSLGLDLPYFCWHPELGSVGACRQCAVKLHQNAEDTVGRLVMSCMTPVTDDMIISMQDLSSSTFRKTNIETIMTGHPHDCPVCEEGGNCHLQDMTVMSGHINRRYQGKKRTHLNQYLGPLLTHEMNRCIGCYRCVRFYRDHCGGEDLNVFGSKSHLYFGRVKPGKLENSFSGNLAEVCPTGVFTDKPFSEHYTRKWDLQTAPTICPHCSLGCNITLGERDGKVRRVTNRHHDDINGHFICNTGRFGYEHVNHSERLDEPLRRNNHTQTTDTISSTQAIQALTQIITPLDTANSHRWIALGSARTHIENNAALMKLVGEDNFYLGVSDNELLMLQMLTHFYQQQGISPLSIKQVQACDCALIINEDISHTAPRLALSIRQMSRNLGIQQAARLGVQYWQDDAVRNIAQDTRSPVNIISVAISELKNIASDELIASPNEQVSLVKELQTLIFNALYEKTVALPLPDEASQLRLKSLSEAITQKTNPTLPLPHTPTSTRILAIAQGLINANNPVVISGLQSQSPTLLKETLLLIRLLKAVNGNTGCYGVTKHANDLHLGMLANQMVTAPVGTKGVNAKDVEKRGPKGVESFVSMLTAHSNKQGESSENTIALPVSIIILETDLYRYIDASQLEAVFDAVDNIIVIDQVLTPTAKMADLVLPATSFAESEGCYLSSEGRLQFAFSTIQPLNHRQMPWRWLSELTGLTTSEQIHLWLSEQNLDFKPIKTFSTLDEIIQASPFNIAKQTCRSSARTAINATSDVKEKPPLSDSKMPFTQSMEGVAGFRQSQINVITVLPANSWSPKWNSDQVRYSNTQDSPWIAGIKIFDSAKTDDRIQECDLSEVSSYEQEALHHDESLTTPLTPKANLYADFELAACSLSVRTMTPEPRISLHSSLAAKLNLAHGELILVKGSKHSVKLICEVNDFQSSAVAQIPNPLLCLLGKRAKLIPLKNREVNDGTS